MTTLQEQMAKVANEITNKYTNKSYAYFNLYEYTPKELYMIMKILWKGVPSNKIQDIPGYKIVSKAYNESYKNIPKYKGEIERSYNKIALERACPADKYMEEYNSYEVAMIDNITKDRDISCDGGGDSDAPDGVEDEIDRYAIDNDIIMGSYYQYARTTRNINIHINKVTDDMVNTHVRVYRYAIEEYRKLAKDNTLIVYGRDCVYLHRIMKIENIPHIYIEGASRRLVQRPGYAKYVVRELNKQMGYNGRLDDIADMMYNAIHIDTGFAGSVPRSLMKIIWKYGTGREDKNVLKLKMLSAENKNDQISPKITRDDVLEIEHSPKEILRAIDINEDGSPMLVYAADRRAAEYLWNKILDKWYSNENIVEWDKVVIKETKKCNVPSDSWFDEYDETDNTWAGIPMETWKEYNLFPGYANLPILKEKMIADNMPPF